MTKITLAALTAAACLASPSFARQPAKAGLHRSGASQVIKTYSGKLSCLRAGISTCLLRSIARARAILRRVECGMITSSI